MENATSVTALRGFIERYERLQQDAAEIAETQKELLAELKGQGYDKAVFLDVIKARKQDSAARAERSAIFNLYMSAVQP